MMLRAPCSPSRGPGWLRGWRFTFGGEERGWDGALATVVEDPECEVFVMLYEIHEQDEPVLDQWEGVDIDLYRKIKVRVDTLDGEQLAWLYVLDDYEGWLPSASYLSVVVEAAEKAGAPADYVKMLHSFPCRSNG